MKRFLLAVGFIALLLPATGNATPQSDIVQQFERLQAMLDIGTSRMDIQKLLVDVKMLVNKLPADSDFAKKADGLIESVKMSFLLTDLVPTKKTAVELCKESLQKDLPGLKAALGKSNKKGRP